MRRRQFLSAATTATLVGASGCMGFNPLSSNSTPPTDAQADYIGYYPPYYESESVASVTVSLTDSSVYVNPLVFGDFTAFELYQVNADGSGSKLQTITPEDMQGELESQPTLSFGTGTVTGGSVLLILCVTELDTKYTYGAYYRPNGEGSLTQLPYDFTVDEN